MSIWHLNLAKECIYIAIYQIDPTYKKTRRRNAPAGLNYNKKYTKAYVSDT